MASDTQVTQLIGVVNTPRVFSWFYTLAYNEQAVPVAIRKGGYWWAFAPHAIYGVPERHIDVSKWAGLFQFWNDKPMPMRDEDMLPLVRGNRAYMIPRLDALVADADEVTYIAHVIRHAMYRVHAQPVTIQGVRVPWLALIEAMGPTYNEGVVRLAVPVEGWLRMRFDATGIMVILRGVQ